MLVCSLILDFAFLFFFKKINKDIVSDPQKERSYVVLIFWNVGRW
jgi:hypothetical protein